jgi:hypothetical protein
MIIAGRVIDEQTQTGIADVNIQIATREGLPLSSTVWQTDNDGYFAIDEPLSVQPALLFTRAAYEKLVIQPDDFWNGRYIELARTGELTEVVVTAKKKAHWFGWLLVAGIGGKILYDQTR